MIRKKWNAISLWGLADDQSLRLKKKIMVSNRVYVTSLLVLVLSILFNVLTGPSEVTAILSFWITFIAIGLFLNYKGYVNASRIGFVIWSNMAIATVSSIMGRGPLMEVYLFTCIVCPFVIFDHKEKGKILFGVLLTVSTFIFIELTAGMSFYHIAVPNRYIHNLKTFDFLCSLLLTVMYCMYIVYEGGIFHDQVQEEREVNRSILNASFDSIWLLDVDFRIVSANDRARRSIFQEFGLEADPGMQFITALREKGFEKDAQRLEAFYERALSGEHFIEEVIFSNTPNAAVCEISFSPVTNNGRINGVAVFVKNITERKQAEIELKKYHALVDQSLDLVLIAEPKEGRILDANRTVLSQLKYTSTELMGLRLTELIHLFDSPNAWEAFTHLMLERKSHVFESQFRRQNGKMLPVEVSVRYVVHSQSPYLMVVARDMTRRKEYEEVLLEQQAYLNQIINSSPYLLWVKDREGKYKLVNQALAKVYGYTPEAMLGKTDDDFGLDHEEVSFYHQKDKEVIETKRSTNSFEEQFTNPVSGVTHWYHIIKTPVIHGDEVDVLGIAIDIGERKKLEKEISELNSLQKAIIDGADYSVISTDLEGVITSFNKCSEEMLGYTAQEVIGRRQPSDFILKEEMADKALLLGKEFDRMVVPGMEALLLKPRLRLEDRNEWTLMDRLGNQVIVASTTRLMQDENRNPIGYLFISADITENKKLQQRLDKIAEEEKKQAWISAGLAELNDTLSRNMKNSQQAYQKALAYITSYLEAHQGGLFIVRQDDDAMAVLDLAACFASGRYVSVSKQIPIGSGLLGQTAADLKARVLNDLPQDFVRISTGLGDTAPRNIYITPLVFEGEAKGVLELATLGSFSSYQQEFLDRAAKVMAATIDLDNRKKNTERLLAESQQLNEKLKAQEEELRISNDELIDKSSLLQASEEELRQQQEELLRINSNIEEKARQLARQNDEIRVKNEQLENARHALKIKAEELQASNHYKSEFLANMSHELRTPLNSILILSNLLLENQNSALSSKQLEFVQVIRKSGTDLLSLINDVLDLAKIEAGRAELYFEETQVSGILSDMERLFREMANNKDIRFTVASAGNVPTSVLTDKIRIEQILKNLLSNAFKFTPAKGSITLTIDVPAQEQEYTSSALLAAEARVRFTVKDTGIGIPEHQQKIIFEAFRQADGSTSRKYGGTGLGLSISRELSFLLGGEIQVQSVEGQGSIFSLTLPVAHEIVPEAAADSEKVTAANDNDFHKASEEALGEAIQDVKEQLEEQARMQEGIYTAGRTVLIIEDDAQFADLLSLVAEEHGFRSMTANTGADGLKTAIEYQPQAILLDVHLPDTDGWTVIKKLKEEPGLSNIPVHIMSGKDYSTKVAASGAISFTMKDGPDHFKTLFERLSQSVSWQTNNVLIVEDNDDQANAVRELFNSRQMSSDVVLSGREALQMLNNKDYDLIILDLALPDTNGQKLLKMIRANRAHDRVRIIIYTGKKLSHKEISDISRYPNTVIVPKTEASYEKLLEETMLFFRHMQKKKQDNGPAGTNGSDLLKDKKVLLVDDDMRNIFALSSVLEQSRMRVLVANDGREALQKLEENPDTDIVLMDIMMPEMDGYEATTAIRAMEKYKDLPVIALTAKAMKGDREKCLEAGASDYVSKPVNTKMLLSLIRVWLSR